MRGKASRTPGGGGADLDVALQPHPQDPARREPDVRAGQVVPWTPESQVGRVDQQPGQVGMHGLGGQDRVSLILSESDIGLPVELMRVESVLLSPDAPMNGPELIVS